MILAGCDYSTKGEHWAILDGVEIVRIYHLPYANKNDLAQRLWLSSTATAKTLYGIETLPGSHVFASMHNAAWVVVEGYVHFRDKGGKLAGVHWHIRTEAARFNRSLIELAPSAWKKGIGISGNAAKETVKEHIQKLYPELPKNLPQDAYDAVGIARAAVILFPETQTPKNTER